MGTTVNLGVVHQDQMLTESLFPMLSCVCWNASLSSHLFKVLKKGLIHTADEEDVNTLVQGPTSLIQAIECIVFALELSKMCNERVPL